MKLQFLFLLFFPLFMMNGQDFSTIRSNYQKAVSDKKICKQMLAKFKNKNNKGLELAYYGAFQAIWAKHTNNPFEKLSTFNNGKRNIDNAVKQKPDELESRLLRYSIQKESPGFLGYKSHLSEDRQILAENVQNIDDEVLKQMIIQILNS